MTRCEMCGYYWQECNWMTGEPLERHASCHYEGPADWAPCEQDDSYDGASDDPAIWGD